METNTKLEELVGKRIRLIEMINDPNPIESGAEGLVYHVGCGVINVDWDNGRNLGLVDGVDKYEILEDLTEQESKKKFLENL